MLVGRQLDPSHVFVLYTPPLLPLLTYTPTAFTTVTNPQLELLLLSPPLTSQVKTVSPSICSHTWITHKAPTLYLILIDNKNNKQKQPERQSRGFSLYPSSHVGVTLKIQADTHYDCRLYIPHLLTHAIRVIVQIRWINNTRVFLCLLSKCTK